MLYELWSRLTFGNALRFLLDFVTENHKVLGSILFIYAVVIFIGAYGGKYVNTKYEEFVIRKSSSLIKDNGSINPDKLVDMIYKQWPEEVKKLPAYIYIKSKKDYWIEKPTVEKLYERLGINEEKAKEILIKNGVIVGESDD